MHHAQTSCTDTRMGPLLLGQEYLSHSSPTPSLATPPSAPVPFSQMSPDIQAVLFPPTHPLHPLCPLHMLDSQKRLCGVTECVPVVRPLRPDLG